MSYLALCLRVFSPATWERQRMSKCFHLLSEQIIGDESPLSRTAFLVIPYCFHETSLCCHFQIVSSSGHLPRCNADVRLIRFDMGPGGGGHDGPPKCF